MASFLGFKIPLDFDHMSWLRRWDRMQDHYLESRQERFKLIVDVIKTTQRDARSVLELGCGTGSLLSVLADAFLAAELIGIDHDPTMLFLANARLQSNKQARLLQRDIRLVMWPTGIPTHLDAVVSATALHWLDAVQLSRVYEEVGRLLKAGGIFINADHVGSESDLVQAHWDQERRDYMSRDPNNDDWSGFWQGYSMALGMDVDGIHNQIANWYEPGIETGLPLSWHFLELKKQGFSAVECFWRKGGDAIYGAIK